MEKEYIMAFSSFYKAAYAQDMLSEAGIKAQLKRLPQELVRSCGTGVYLRTSDIGEAESVLEMRQISVRGVYEIKREGKGTILTEGRILKWQHGWMERLSLRR